MALCLSRKVGRFVSVQKRLVENSGARGLAGALASSGADVGVGMEARVCAAVSGAGESGKPARGSAELAQVFFGDAYLSAGLVVVSRDQRVKSQLFSGRRFVCRASSDVCAVARAVFVDAPVGGASGASVVEAADPVSALRDDVELVYVDDWAHAGLVRESLKGLGTVYEDDVGVPFLFAPVYRLDKAEPVGSADAQGRAMALAALTTCLGVLVVSCWALCRFGARKT